MVCFTKPVTGQQQPHRNDSDGPPPSGTAGWEPEHDGGPAGNESGNELLTIGRINASIAEYCNAAPLRLEIGTARAHAAHVGKRSVAAVVRTRGVEVYDQRGTRGCRQRKGRDGTEESVLRCPCRECRHVSLAG